MRFDLRSVLLNDGVVISVKVHLPEALQPLVISKTVWHKAVIEFNKRLNKRVSVTEEINDHMVDVMQMDNEESLQLAVNRNDVDLFNAMWFSIKGQVYFKGKSLVLVDEVQILEVIYKDVEGNVHPITNKNLTA